MIYVATVYCDLGPKLGLVVRKRLASLEIKSSEASWSSNCKSISEVKDGTAIVSPFGNTGP